MKFSLKIETRAGASFGELADIIERAVDLLYINEAGDWQEPIRDESGGLVGEMSLYTEE